MYHFKGATHVNTDFTEKGSDFYLALQSNFQAGQKQ